jgi:REP element-mobilizing transposase RayT
MPEHLHLLIAGSAKSHLSSFMKAFKQTTSYRYKNATGQPLWQKSFYDHIIRDEKDCEAALFYVIGNRRRRRSRRRCERVPVSWRRLGGRDAGGDYLSFASTSSK